MNDKLPASEPEKMRGILRSSKDSQEYTFLFEYHLEYKDYLDGYGYIFSIWEEGRESLGSFSFQLRVMENGSDLKVTDLYSDADRYYNGKGISIAIILESKKIFNKQIISSSNKIRSSYTEFNTEIAIEKVWKILVENGLANYNSDLDYYYTL